MVFTLLGGLFAIRIGLVRAMFLSGILMAVTNLMFSWLAWAGPVETLFAAAVLLDDLAAAFAQLPLWRLFRCSSIESTLQLSMLY